MKAILILALAAAMPTAASAVTVTFGGLFGPGTPVTNFSAPGDRFRVTFENRPEFLNFSNSVLATYRSGGITQRFNAQFTVNQFGNEPSSFLFRPGGLFDFPSFSIRFDTRRSFFEDVDDDRGLVRLTRSTALLNGVASQFLIENGSQGAILNPSFLRLDFGAGAGASAGTALRAGGSEMFQTSVPEPGSWALMIAGFGAVGATLRRRRPVALAA